MNKSQPRYFNPANVRFLLHFMLHFIKTTPNLCIYSNSCLLQFHPPQEIVQPTITTGFRGGTFITPNAPRIPIASQISTRPVVTPSLQARTPMLQTAPKSNMSRPRGVTFITPNLTSTITVPTSLQARPLMPQAVSYSHMSRPSMHTTPQSSFRTSKPWKPPGKVACTKKATTSSQKKHI